MENIDLKTFQVFITRTSPADTADFSVDFSTWNLFVFLIR